MNGDEIVFCIVYRQHYYFINVISTHENGLVTIMMLLWWHQLCWQLQICGISWFFIGIKFVIVRYRSSFSKNRKRAHFKNYMFANGSNLVAAWDFIAPLKRSTSSVSWIHLFVFLFWREFYKLIRFPPIDGWRSKQNGHGQAKETVRNGAVESGISLFTKNKREMRWL